jgi:hypothetical protein
MILSEIARKIREVTTKWQMSMTRWHPNEHPRGISSYQWPPAIARLPWAEILKSSRGVNLDTQCQIKLWTTQEYLSPMIYHQNFGDQLSEVNRGAHRQLSRSPRRRARWESKLVRVGRSNYLHAWVIFIIELWTVSLSILPSPWLLYIGHRAHISSLWCDSHLLIMAYVGTSCGAHAIWLVNLWFISLRILGRRSGWLR